MADEKRILWDYLDVYNSPDNPRNVHLLSERDVQALAFISTAILWKSRWLNVPSGQWDNVEAYLAELLERIYFPVDLCDLINQCINSGNVPAAGNLVLSGGGPGTYIPPETALQDVVNPGTDIRELPDCDLDKLWAGLREIVQRVDEEGRDVLEDMANLNDQLERIQAFVDLVPGLGDTIADVGEFFTQAVPDLLTAYNAYSSPSTLDAAACDLFTIVCDQCRYPTYEEILTYFFQRSALSFLVAATAQRAAIWNAARVVSLDPTICWHTVNALQLWVLSVSGRWGRAWGRNTIQVYASFGEDFANDNWIALCGECGDTYEVPADGNGFTGSPSPLEIAVNAGDVITITYLGSEWGNGTGWVGGPFGEPGFTDPSTLIPSANVGALIWRNPDNNTQWQTVGTGFTYTVTNGTSPLILAMNDRQNGYADNTGFLRVKVQIN